MAKSPKIILKGPLPEIMCACGQKFRPKNGWQRFHSPECRRTEWETKNRRINPKNKEDVAHLIALVESARPGSALFIAMKKAVYRKVQKGSRKK